MISYYSIYLLHTVSRNVPLMLLFPYSQSVVFLFMLRYEKTFRDIYTGYLCPIVSGEDAISGRLKGDCKQLPTVCDLAKEYSKKSSQNVKVPF